MSAQSGRFLLLDDEPLVLRALARGLSSAGHMVEVFTDPERAIARLADGKIDGMFSDISMPAMSGLEVLQQVRNLVPDLPVVLMTASPSLVTAIQAVERGALRYLLKPIGLSALNEAAQVILTQRRTTPEVASTQRLSARFEELLSGVFMAYQPIVAFDQRKTVAYEALLRTADRAVHPGMMLEMGERTGGLPALGRKIRRLVAEAARIREGEFFINLHPCDLLDEDLYDPEAPLSAVSRRVVLEITERATLDDVDDLQNRMRRLRSLGFRVAIDDLGAGYAALASIAKLDPEFIKLDMSLVRNIHQAQTNLRIVESVIRMCGDLKIAVIAEGVECAEERDALMRIGCPLLQGYLFARPAADFPTPNW